MSGFEIFLCVIAGIILFFVLVLSIPVHLSLTYTDKVYLSVKYAFIKLNVLPLGSGKEKKPKQKKEEPQEEKPEEEQAEEETPKEKKPNPIIDMVKANGFDGMLQVIQNLGSVFAKFGGNLMRSVSFNEIIVYATIGTGDAASTAIKYGETCEKIFPVFGFICNNNKVKKYDIDISPDFLANKTEYEMQLDMQVVIRKIINAVFGLIGRLIVKVALKFFINSKKKKEVEAPEAETVNQVN